MAPRVRRARPAQRRAAPRGAAALAPWAATVARATLPDPRSATLRSSSGGSAGSSSGGSAGSAMGGAGGSAGAPHVVGQCNALPPAGTWERISPPPWSSSSKNEALGVLLSPDVSGVVYAAAGDKTNGGNGWYRRLQVDRLRCHLDQSRHRRTQRRARDRRGLGHGDQSEQRTSPLRSERLWRSRIGCKSDNGGVDWTVLMPDGGALAEAIGGNFVQHFSLDPMDGRHVVAVFHFNCTGAYAPMCMAESNGQWHDLARCSKGQRSRWSRGRRSTADSRQNHLGFT